MSGEDEKVAPVVVLCDGAKSSSDQSVMEHVPPQGRLAHEPQRGRPIKQHGACGPKRRAYTWGEKPAAAKCNTAESGIGFATPVARYQSGVSLYGVRDLRGNVREWRSTPCADGPDRHELSGAAFSSPFVRAAPALENAANSSMKDNGTGFRCS
ncbi:SUMF1/EgtB/PvdO family nonheme iron enzyme [Streptomyces sp. DB-54]